ncbi:TetR/AcrR family transcriptional regulator [Streptomyces sp. A7024]|uniref:TetR/AcrR family transcriptional regulator n=1 Tax=Streptomyces coryli TaxID=1128680 RepID=A0A6G4UC97_9ACTN|nr:TetR/AcrR family transcriptional regulator C-terminal domain-containing protein [Streptomyces coryli]NGN68957.1 TetR/AcrR family transcriptional regulator [Streptomyces coryli]
MPDSPGKPARTPVSRRDRPAKAPLSQEAIVSAGLDLLSSEGLPGLSLRKIATALDTGPASLYVYVSNLDELRALVLDRALGEVDLAAGADGPPRERLKAVLRSYQDVLLSRPGLARLASTTMARGKGALRLTETLLDCLAEAGVAGRDGAWGADLLLLQVTASAAEKSAWEEQGDVIEQVKQTYEHASATDYPRIHALGEQIFSGHGERWDWALDVVIEGIARVSGDR